MSETSVVHVGIDVHKDTNSVCVFSFEENRIYSEAQIDAGAENLDRYLKKVKKQFDLEDCIFFCGYEAGPTGYGLCRSLQKRGYDCVIIAPTTIFRPTGEKVKTDRKDARLLAVTLASNTYKAVYLPDVEDEATKELTRARNALMNHQKKARQQLLSFLLRIGHPYPDSGNYWTVKFNDWLNTLHFENSALQTALETYIREVRELEAKVREMDARLESICEDERYKENVDKLICFAGIDKTIALSICCEIGDFARFETAEKFSSYIGLCPSQDSSGKTVRMGGITKCGNSRIRKLMIEAVNAIKKSNPYNKSKRVQARQRGQDPLVIAYADKGVKRIKNKIQTLEKHGKNHNVAKTAGARELACFIWGMMNGFIAA